MGARSICCGVSGITLVVISLLFYVVAIGVGWGTFKQNIGGDIAGPVVISIPVLVVFFSLSSMASVVCCGEDNSKDCAVGCGGFMCVVGGLIVIAGGIVLIVTGHSNNVKGVFDAYIAAGVFAICSGITYYCGMGGIIYGLESEIHSGSKDESNSSPVPRD